MSGGGSGASVVCQKFAKEAGGLSSVMPAKAGIQKHSIFPLELVLSPVEGRE